MYDTILDDGAFHDALNDPRASEDLPAILKYLHAHDKPTFYRVAALTFWLFVRHHARRLMHR
jgi:hypothetical protein